MLKQLFEDINFFPLHNYIEKLESNIITIDNIEKKGSKGKKIIGRLKNGIDLEIGILNDSEKSWIVFHFKSGVDLEKIEFYILKNEIYEGINRTIRHDYWYKENDTLTTVNSLYTYLNNDYKTGGESIRKIAFNDFKETMIHDNLNELTLTIDRSNIPILVKEEIDDIVIEPNLDTVMIDGKKYNSEVINKLFRNNGKLKLKK